MFLRGLLALLLFWGVLRLFRAVGPAPARPTPPEGKRRGLDPEREVRASWSEVEDDGAGR
ncbi:MAG: hypothetical protein R3B81_12325 [bacterium]